MLITQLWTTESQLKRSCDCHSKNLCVSSWLWMRRSNNISAVSIVLANNCELLVIFELLESDVNFFVPPDGDGGKIGLSYVGNDRRLDLSKADSSARHSLSVAPVRSRSFWIHDLTGSSSESSSPSLDIIVLHVSGPVHWILTRLSKTFEKCGLISCG